jgi:hypothetical protein
MENTKPGVSRSKFVVWGIGVLASFTALRFLTAGKTKAATNDEGKKLRMLDQNGVLVEVDASFISAKRRKVTDRELQFWVKNKAANKN